MSLMTRENGAKNSIKYVINRFNVVKSNQNQCLSNVDKQSMFLIEFQNECDLYNITFYFDSYQLNYNPFQPTKAAIYKATNEQIAYLNQISNRSSINDEQIPFIKCEECNCNKSIECEITNGKTINLKERAIFSKTKYLIILLQSKNINIKSIEFIGNDNYNNMDYIMEPSTAVEFYRMMTLFYPNKLIVVQFFANWCPHSRRITNSFRKVAKKFKNNAVFIKIDMDKMDNLSKNFNISATPTFKLIRNYEILDTIAGSNIKAVMNCIQQYV
eukprot:478355_1